MSPWVNGKTHVPTSPSCSFDCRVPFFWDGQLFNTENALKYATYIHHKWGLEIVLKVLNLLFLCYG